MRKVFLLLTINILVCTIDTYCISFLDIDTCSVSIITNDTIIYSDTPTTVQIQLQATQGAFSYNWSPTAGLSDPTIHNPMAQITGSIEYVLEAKYLGENLVYNGNFELGNTGFTTDLNYYSTGPTTRGIYSVLSNAHSFELGFCPCNNGGNYMIIDGSTIPEITVYSSRTIVEPNQDYVFSLDLSTINNDPNQSPGNIADIYVLINNVVVENHLMPSANCCIWQTLTLPWNSGNDTTATIIVKDHNTGPWGNDFALDNISLKSVCKAYDTVNITIYDADIIPKDIYITICENDFPYQYFDSVFYQAGIYGYVFSTNSETDSLHIVNISTNPQYNITIYDTICEGETYTLNGFNVYTQGQHTLNLQTLQGCDSIINLNLYVESIEDTIIDAVICNGQVYTTYGFNQHLEGTYYGYYHFSGKCNTRIILNLSVINSVEMLLFPQEDMMVEQYPITLDATCTGCDSYIWSSGQSSPTINVYSKGMYKVCAFSDCGYICDSVVINNPDVYVFLPNSFTPSNSSNTVFEIYTQKEKVELVVFEIFDRWGEKIFETKDIYEGWDGTFKGKLCNSDVFAYKVLYKTRYTQDQVFEKTGLVSLIR